MKHKDFPMTKKWIFLDNASITLKPIYMINEISNFYKNFVANPHSKDNLLGINVINIISDTKKIISKLVNSKENEVIFTSGATESANLLISSLFQEKQKKYEIIVYKDLHSSVIITLIENLKKTNVKIHYVFTKLDFQNTISKNINYVFFSEINNTTGTLHDAKFIYDSIKKVNSNCIIVNDASQSISHKKVNFKYCDALFFSAGKFYGPSGLGCLVINEKLRSKLKPTKFGGGTIKFISENKWISINSIKLWEAGTPNIAGIFGFRATLKYLISLNLNKIFEKEKEISKYAWNKLKKISGITIFSEYGSPIILFVLKDYPSQDVVSAMGHNNIITRAGFHCSNISDIINYKKSTIRLSIGLYNNKDDIDRFIKFIKKGNFLNEIIK